MVCHGDRNLIRQKGRQAVSYYIDPTMMSGSAHASVQCTGCHVDFAYKAPHNDKDWRKNAKLACKNCHNKEYQDFSLGAHAVRNTPGQADPKADQKPLCGDCHGSHAIEGLTKDPQARAALRANGYQIFGRCHQQEWDQYSDYYHGAAYRRGAEDAPACWDCHGAHTVRPSKDVQSPTNQGNLIDTCSGKVTGRGCHQGVTESFVEYAGFVHHREEAMQQNWLYATIAKTREGISAALSNIVDTVRSLIG
jgi:nitrate/TMAO reductase-like tetraheme cytochrome c subunit